MRGGLKRRLALCCAIVLVAIPACSQIAGFDGPPPASGVADAGKPPPPPLPFLPFVPQPAYAETCMSCAADKCNAQHQACVDDPQCRGLLRCHGACSDPLCVARCGAYDLLDYSWGPGSGWTAGRRGAENALLGAYQECVSVDCPNDCGSGLDWGCLDKSSRYRWPSDPVLENGPLHVKLEVLFLGNQGVSARVSAYPPSGSGMDVLLLASDTSGWGQIELEFPRAIDPILQIESQARALDEFHVLNYSGPFFRDTRLSIDVFPSDLEPVYPHAGFASVIIVVSDCIAAPAVGITFELEGAKGQLYKVGGGGFDFVDTKTDFVGVGGFEDVSPANATVTVLAKRGEQTVAQRMVLLRENWVTSVVLRPLSGDE